jgi:hypothetical protein
MNGLNDTRFIYWLFTCTYLNSKIAWVYMKHYIYHIGLFLIELENWELSWQGCVYSINNCV